MQNITIGKCSVCGGKVVVPSVWYSTEEPVPTCKKCGAEKENDLPEIKMKKKGK